MDYPDYFETARYYVDNLRPTILKDPLMHCCPYCFAPLKTEPSDWSKHVRKCPFVRFVSEKNPKFTVVFPTVTHMTTLNIRARSFHGDWHDVQEKINLIENGFFYERRNDSVRCFFCGVGNWNYKVAENHFECNPACEYAKFRYANRDSNQILEMLCSEDRDRLDDPFAQQMAVEKNRMYTFFLGGWSSSFEVDPDDLARAGFFYLFEGDRVQCAFCNIQLGEWKPDNLPMERHMQESRCCPFFRESLVCNVPELALEVTVPRNTSLIRWMDLSKRLDTFEKWPHKFGPSGSDFAQAGFYYTGVKDVVQCLWCDVMLWDFENRPTMDDAMEMHKIERPGCVFLELEKIRRYSEEVPNDDEQQWV